MPTTNKPTATELRKASERSKDIIAEWVKNNRIKADLSQAQLADLAKIDRKTINRIERGHFSPSVDTMTRVAIVLGKSLPQLV